MQKMQPCQMLARGQDGFVDRVDHGKYTKLSGGCCGGPGANHQDAAGDCVEDNETRLNWML